MEGTCKPFARLAQRVFLVTGPGFDLVIRFIVPGLFLGGAEASPPVPLYDQKSDKNRTNCAAVHMPVLVLPFARQ